MPNPLESAKPVLSREPSRFSSCLFQAEIPTEIGRTVLTGRYYVDQCFGTDSILDSVRRPRRPISQAVSLLSDPTLVFRDPDYIFAANALIHASYGPITGNSESAYFRLQEDDLHEIENHLATKTVLKELDGSVGYLIKRAKGIRPKNDPAHRLQLTELGRQDFHDFGLVTSACGIIDQAELIILRLDLNYRSHTLSMANIYLTGCMPAEDAINLIQTEESKPPEERLSRFIADIYRLSGGTVSCRIPN